MDLQAYLSDLEYLVNLDSGSEYPEGLNRVAAFFHQRFQELGWIVEAHDLAPHSGTCLVCKNREAEHYDVMLLGHMDTVFPLGTCAQRPFRKEGDTLYGPGVCDMKQGCLLMYYLMKALPEELLSQLNILAVFNPDEEIGSIYSAPVYASYAKKTDYCFLYEARATNGSYCIERPGSIQFTMEFTGQAGHCGFVFRNDARSAISEMARWIVALDGLQNKERNTTVNVGVVHGGTKGNVVADKAGMTVDIRFRQPEEAARVEQLLEQLQAQATENRIGYTYLTRRSKPAWTVNEKSRAYLEHICQLGKEQGVPVKFEVRGGLSDANLVSQYGPICLDGMGLSAAGGHSEKEYALIKSFDEVWRFSNMLFADLAAQKQR